MYADWLHVFWLLTDGLRIRDLAAAAATLAGLLGLLLWQAHHRARGTRKAERARAVRGGGGLKTEKPLPQPAEVTFPLSELVEQNARGFAARAEAKGLHFTTGIAAGLAPTIRAERASIDLVIQSLLDNAVKFTDEGAVRLEVAPERDASGRPHVRFNVYDTGAGMDAETLSQLLDSDAPASSDSRHGLAMARRLVARMGGHLGAESEPRGGSTFWFTVPVVMVEAARPTRPEPICDLTAPAHVPDARPGLLRAPRPGKRILIVDPDLAAQVAILWGVGALGYHGEVVSCAAEAIETWQRKPFDLILLDCEMADADETARRVRGLETGCIPIVAMSHAGHDPSISIDDRLGKPVCLQALSRTLDHWLGDAAPVFASEASSDKLSLPV